MTTQQTRRICAPSEVSRAPEARSKKFSSSNALNAVNVPKEEKHG
jgi:hypothetical protein